MKPEFGETPVTNRYVAFDDARREAAPSASPDDGTGEAMLRRRARSLALLLMILSSLFMIVLAVGAWFLLRG
jgi:hypothetical protein